MLYGLSRQRICSQIVSLHYEVVSIFNLPYFPILRRLFQSVFPETGITEQGNCIRCIAYPLKNLIYS